MALDLNMLNKIYTLAKDKGSTKWEVCVFMGEHVISNDGKLRKLGKAKDMLTRRRFFRTAVIHESTVVLKVNDRVEIEFDEGNLKDFYIVEQGTKLENGNYEYIAAI